MHFVATCGQSVKLNSGLDGHKEPVWPQQYMAGSTGSLWTPYQLALASRIFGKDGMFHTSAVQSRSYYVQVALEPVKCGSVAEEVDFILFHLNL